MDQSELVAIWFRALENPIGILVETNDADRLRAKLYEARKPYSELQNLLLRLDPTSPKTRVFIFHKEIKVPKDAKESD